MLLKSGITNGMDISLILLSTFLRQHICVLFPDHLWISNQVKVEDCGIFLIHSDNHFNGVVKRNGFSLLIDFDKVKSEVLSTSYVSITGNESADHPSSIKREDNVETQKAEIGSHHEEMEKEQSAEIGSNNEGPGLFPNVYDKTTEEEPIVGGNSQEISFNTLQALDEESVEHRYDEDILPSSSKSVVDKWRKVPMQIGSPLFMLDGDASETTNINKYLNMLGREIFDVPNSNDHLFNSIRPQIMPTRSSKYTGRHMRYHVLQYFNEHKEDLHQKLIPMLKYRPSLSLKKWEQMMIQRDTCGYELTLVIIDQMFDIPILVLREDYIWTSREIVPFKCPIVLVLTRDGNFKGTKGHRVRVGQVPKVAIPRVVQVNGKSRVIWPKSKDLQIKEASVSTPKLPTSIDVVHPVFPEMINDISPITDIVENQANRIMPLQDATNHQNNTAASETSSFDTYSETLQHCPPPPAISARRINDKSIEEKNIAIVESRKEPIIKEKSESKTDKRSCDINEKNVDKEPNSDDASRNIFDLNIFEPIADEESPITETKSTPKKKETEEKKDKEHDLRELNITLEKLDISSTVTIQREEPKEYTVVKYRCRKCGDVSVTREGYRAHLFQAHDIRRVGLHLPEEVTCVTISSIEKSSPNAEGKKEYVLYTCSLCHDQFNVRHELRQHFTDEHGLFKKCPKFGVPCGLCCKRFYFEIGMGDHLKNEHGIVGGVKSMEKLVKQNIPYEERKKPPTVDVINSAIGIEFPKEMRDKFSKVATLSEKIKDRVMSQTSKRVTRAQKQKKLEEEFERDKRQRGSNSDVSDNPKPKSSDNKKSEISDLARGSSQIDSEHNEPASDHNDEQDDDKAKKQPKDIGRGRTRKRNASPVKKFKSKNPSDKYGKKNRKTYSLRSRGGVKAEPVSDDEVADPEWQESSTERSPKKKTTKQNVTPKKDSTSSGKKRKVTQSEDDEPSKKPKKQADDDDFSYPCEKCEETFDNYDDLQQHRHTCSKYPKKHICPKCKKGFQQKSLLDQHYRRRHTNLPPLFVCKECNIIFEFEKTMKRHNKKYHDPDAQKFICETCGKSFVTRWEFKQHRNGVHLNLKEFLCGRCKDQAFTTAGRLQQHLKTCGVEKKFKCDLCDGKFISQLNLNTHIEDHHNKKKKVCPVKDCGKTYTSTGGFHYHMRTAHSLGRKGAKSVRDYKKEMKTPAKEEDKTDSDNE